MSLSRGPHLAFPFRIGTDGRTVSPADDATHIHAELLQLLLTNPGERPFIPEFGGGLRKLAFEPTSDVMRNVTKARITQAVSRWLAHRVTLESLEVEFNGEEVDITVRYRIAGGMDSRVVKFQRKGQ